MKFSYSVRLVLAASLLGAAVYTGLAYGQSDSNSAARPVSDALATAVQEVEQQEKAFNTARGQAARAPFYADNILNMHTSGWLYTKTDDAALMGRGTAFLGGERPFKTDITKRQVVAFSRDLAAVVWVTTMYYPVPDPEDLAEQQGIKTLDPAGIAKARQNIPPAPLPGERYAPNPYRARYIHVWARNEKNGKWQIVVAAAAKITARTLPGRFPVTGLGGDSEIDR